MSRAPTKQDGALFPKVRTEHGLSGRKAKEPELHRHAPPLTGCLSPSISKSEIRVSCEARMVALNHAVSRKTPVVDEAHLNRAVGCMGVTGVPLGHVGKRNKRASGEESGELFAVGKGLMYGLRPGENRKNAC